MALRKVDTGAADAPSLRAPREALDRAERELAARVPEVRTGPIPNVTTLQRLLPAHSALIGFALGRTDPWAGEHLRPNELPQSFYAFLLTTSGAPRLLDLGDSQSVSTAVQHWTAALRDPNRPIADVVTLGEDLRRLV